MFGKPQNEETFQIEISFDISTPERLENLDDEELVRSKLADQVYSVVDAMLRDQNLYFSVRRLGDGSWKH